MRVGFIGLGTMGQHMAANLRAAGHELVVHDVRREAAEPHLAAGATWADAPAAVGEAVEVVFTSLPGPPEVESVALGEDGLLAGMPAGTTYFDLSTNSPAMVQLPDRLHWLRRGEVAASYVAGASALMPPGEAKPLLRAWPR